MYCNNCRKRLAKIHITQIKKNNIVELHYCAYCASKKADHPLVKKLLHKQKLSRLQLWEYLFRLNPNIPAVYRELGKSYTKIGKFDEAKKIYRKGIEVAQQTGELQTGKEMKVFLKRLENKK